MSEEARRREERSKREERDESIPAPRITIQAPSPAELIEATTSGAAEQAAAAAAPVAAVTTTVAPAAIAGGLAVAAGAAAAVRRSYESRKPRSVEQARRLIEAARSGGSQAVVRRSVRVVAAPLRRAWVGSGEGSSPAPAGYERYASRRVERGPAAGAGARVHQVHRAAAPHGRVVASHAAHAARRAAGGGVSTSAHHTHAHRSPPYTSTRGAEHATAARGRAATISRRGASSVTHMIRARRPAHATGMLAAHPATHHQATKATPMSRLEWIKMTNRMVMAAHPPPHHHAATLVAAHAAHHEEAPRWAATSIRRPAAHRMQVNR